MCLFDLTMRIYLAFRIIQGKAVMYKAKLGADSGIDFEKDQDLEIYGCTFYSPARQKKFQPKEEE